MRLPSGVVGVVLGACGAVAIAACAAGGRGPASAGGGMPVAITPGGTDGRSEIQRLDRELGAARDKLGLPEPPVPLDHGSGAASPLAVTPQPPTPDPTCHPAKTDTCSDTCTLADAICTDATKICELARQLPGDTWAAGRCSSGDQSCTAAHARCCGCP